MAIFEPLKQHVEADTAYAVARLLAPHGQYTVAALLKLNSAAGGDSETLDAALSAIADVAERSAYIPQVRAQEEDDPLDDYLL